jgi:hypothetical protein
MQKIKVPSQIENNYHVVTFNLWIEKSKKIYFLNDKWRILRVGLRAHLFDTVEDGQVEVLLSTLAGGDAAHHVGAILDGLLAVEGALLAREALADHLGAAVDHQIRPRRRVIRSHA